jgi:hypothetical protein
MKVKVFMWHALKDRIQTGVVLGEGVESKQKLWDMQNTRNLLGAGLKEAQGWDRVPGNMPDFLEHWVPLRRSDYNGPVWMVG